MPIRMDKSVVGWIVFGGMATLALIAISYSIYRKRYLQSVARGVVTAAFLFLGYFGVVWIQGANLDAILTKGSFLLVSLSIAIPFVAGLFCKGILELFSRRRGRSSDFIVGSGRRGSTDADG